MQWFETVKNGKVSISTTSKFRWKLKKVLFSSHKSRRKVKQYTTIPESCTEEATYVYFLVVNQKRRNVKAFLGFPATATAWNTQEFRRNFGESFADNKANPFVKFSS